jgi:hypothetical protein
MAGLTGPPVAGDSILEIHCRFCAELPEDLLWVEDPATRQKLRVVPGEPRQRTLDTRAIRSIARGLAGNVAAYKGHLAACDLRRRDDLDGRGNLSEESLAGFTKFFLTVCIDQVAFVERLMTPDRSRAYCCGPKRRSA